jgi:hypothetical protein
MSDEQQELKNLVLAKLDQVLGKIDGLYEELGQIKVHLSGLETGVNALTKSAPQ